MLKKDGKIILITGAAGYVGAMLVDQFSRRDDVKEVIGLDKEPMPDILKGNKKLFWMNNNTSDKEWQGIVANKNPEIIIHTAWQIREMYGKKDMQWLWNVTGSSDVFDFAFNTPSVKKLIYFSTISSYGASAENTFDDVFKENDPFLENEYLYAVEKRVVEEDLKRKYIEAKDRNNTLQVFVVRPASITGPRMRAMQGRFGLQSALSGRLGGSFLHKMICVLVSVIPVTKTWVRQFIHEDDVTDIVSLLAFEDLKGGYEVFNICPPGSPVFSKDMAEAVNKSVLPIYPWMARFAFFWFRHLTRGKIPTSKGVWRFYSYPIVVDGSKLTRQYGYKYKYSSRDAFVKREGYYVK